MLMHQIRSPPVKRRNFVYVRAVYICTITRIVKYVNLHNQMKGVYIPGMELWAAHQMLGDLSETVTEIKDTSI